MILKKREILKKEIGSILLWNDEEIGEISVSFMEASDLEDIWYL